ncbi:Major Facilitator Superfamily protein [Quadrisphaera sp. DSM 44207]|nr:MFS transporter [Quadrisphaera sp. DSM 44207]SDQ21394.1 Major Facilitator Superfamily protein [Quadrisphaera sp. DSM 44207]
MNVSGAAAEEVLNRTLMPRLHAAFSLGSLVGAGSAVLLASAGVPVGPHAAGAGLAAAAALVVLVRGLPADAPTRVPAPAPAADVPAVAPDVGTGRAPSAWREPQVLLIGSVVFGAAFAEGSANDWIGLVVVDDHHIGQGAGAAVLGVFLTAVLLTRLAGARVLDRFGRVLVVRASAGCAAAGLALVVLAPTAPVAVLGVALWGTGTALGFPVGMSAAADDPTRAAARVGVVSTVGYGAFLVGPPLIGALGERVGLSRALLVVLVAVLLSGAAAGAVRAPRRDAASSGGIRGPLRGCSTSPPRASRRPPGAAAP